ncbi:hypothetical protein [uncultured Alteromonas sp.]|jgi:hypothetical protein|nr:hypothetical protein [uncultured Alteromonas sp.]
MSSVVMASVAPVVLMDYSSLNEQRLPYSLRRGHLLISLCSWINNR